VQLAPGQGTPWRRLAFKIGQGDWAGAGRGRRLSPAAGRFANLGVLEGVPGVAVGALTGPAEALPAALGADERDRRLGHRHHSPFVVEVFTTVLVAFYSAERFIDTEAPDPRFASLEAYGAALTTPGAAAAFQTTLNSRGGHRHRDRTYSGSRRGDRPGLPGLATVRLRALERPPRDDRRPQGRICQPDPLFQRSGHRLSAPPAGSAAKRLGVRLRRQLRARDGLFGTQTRQRAHCFR